MLLSASFAVPTVGAAARREPGCQKTRWVGAWATSLQSPVGSPARSGALLHEQTVRMVVRPTISGRALRLRFNNRFGQSPPRIRTSFVGTHAGGGAITGPNVAVRFPGGRSSVTVPAGTHVFSSPLRFSVHRSRDLALSFHVAGRRHVDFHPAAQATAYLSEPGPESRAGSRSARHFPWSRTMFHVVDALDVRTPRSRGAVVALGDSLTDGWASTLDANQRWPDLLLRRLASNARWQDLSVLNAGLSGNQVAWLGPGPDLTGPAALERLDHDVFARPGVTDLLVAIGINDLALSAATAGSVLAAYRSIVQRAHARGINVIGATLPPAGGNPIHGNAFVTVQRQALNDAIRTGRVFDHVVDFDTAVRDPLHPDRLLPKYDSGDHLHPSDAGYAALSEALDLADLRGRDPELGACTANAAKP